MFNSKELTVAMVSILSALKSLVLRYIDEEAWAWAGDGECIAWDVYPLLNLKDEEVSNFATTSCRPTLWAFRALANRLGVPVPAADWFWHNEPRAQFRRFVAMAMEARAIVGAPAGHEFGRALGFLARGLEVKYEFTRKGDTIARAYWSDCNPETGEEVGGCISVYSPIVFDYVETEEEAMEIQTIRLAEGAYTSVRTEEEDGWYSVKSDFEY